ncbi:Uncharacterized protein dnm_046760 [Desulfonema magnum]|uniref:Uncharacterized protein n=1 Tax=Desulfonema magnum TaxID=45655 RepID=A0A975BP73_9BACT|nr:Uncharacterized protein dnm_046760 [Desulfonema magnum]
MIYTYIKSAACKAVNWSLPQIRYNQDFFSMTLKVEATISYGSPSDTPKIAIIRFAPRRSPLFSACLSIFSSSRRVVFSRTMRIFPVFFSPYAVCFCHTLSHPAFLKKMKILWKNFFLNSIV